MKSTPQTTHLHAEVGGTRRERTLFDALRAEGEEYVRPGAILTLLDDAGISPDDPRVKKCVDRLHRAPGFGLTFAEFSEAIAPGLLMLERVVTRELAIPEFAEFSAELIRIFEHTSQIRTGAVANYIPQLGRVDPGLYGMTVTTIDGQRLSLGDSTVPFCVQSSVKPIIYSLALEEHGESVVHQHVGCEPSGHSFNELTLNAQGRPHNPMINAGAIMSSSLIRPTDSMADRFDYVLDRWASLAGGRRPGFSNPTYLSERRTADRNFALGYFMREKQAFPEGADLVETLEFYFQCCSLEVTTEYMSVVAATLANGGVCPLTGERVFSPDTVQKCLSLMYSCGMYDFSGEWAFRIGLPAKSGVSGVIMVVVPNVLGLCVWSPPLDALGNSVRGIEFCRCLVSAFNFHNYDNMVGGLSPKRDPRLRRDELQRDLLVDLIWASSEGDRDGIRRLVVKGADVNAADYDGRTPLHLAASEGRADVVAYLLELGADPAALDRWGNTALEDARRGGHEAIRDLLTARLAA
jgi:glutaminase